MVDAVGIGSQSVPGQLLCRRRSGAEPGPKLTNEFYRKRRERRELLTEWALSRIPVGLVGALIFVHVVVGALRGCTVRSRSPGRRHRGRRPGGSERSDREWMPRHRGCTGCSAATKGIRSRCSQSGRREGLRAWRCGRPVGGATSGRGSPIGLSSVRGRAGAWRALRRPHRVFCWSSRRISLARTVNGWEPSRPAAIASSTSSPALAP